ncbi:formate-nitrite transporter, putative [Plasmodium vinckei lentum]|uniref:Formate-nitrite transporter n=1 Tax=Plasmodium vinckei lentum TaxID=138297 RepID=A0A6V7RWX8_PLAVN|nr:formate-nitrite transporter, putative [Plasmodium vinckei lentum]
MGKIGKQYILDPTSVKTTCSSEESYIRCVEYGKAKAAYSNFNLFLKAILAGIFVGLCAHASGIAGSDLFTGNTLAVTIALLQKKVKLLSYIRVMTISLLGNYIGAVSFAFIVSYGSGAFHPQSNIEKNHIYEFLNAIAMKKVHHTFSECISLAIGCNIFVCLAVYFVLSIKDGSGVVFSVFFAVYAFAIAGYEHIIANIYTLNIALMVNANVTFTEVYFNNLIPTLIGNYIAGAVVLACPFYLLYNHYYEDYETKSSSLGSINMKGISIEMQND